MGKIDFLNVAKLSGSGGIFARARLLLDLEKVPGFRQEPEPKSGTALLQSARMSKLTNDLTRSGTGSFRAVPI